MLAGESVFCLQGEVCQCSVPYLHAGCSYQVRVRAQNSMGWGPLSETLSLTARPGPPMPPSAPRCAKRKADALEMEWDAPASNGGAAVAAYRLEMAGEPPCVLALGPVRLFATIVHAAGWLAFCAPGDVLCLQSMSVACRSCIVLLHSSGYSLHCAHPPCLLLAPCKGQCPRLQELFSAALRSQPFLHGITGCPAAVDGQQERSLTAADPATSRSCFLLPRGMHLMLCCWQCAVVLQAAFGKSSHLCGFELPLSPAYAWQILRCGTQVAHLLLQAALGATLPPCPCPTRAGAAGAMLTGWMQAQSTPSG